MALALLLPEVVLRSVNDLLDFTIGATDGDIGLVEEFYFDVADWAVRYIAVNTGGWFNARRVLLPPFSIDRIDWTGRLIETPLTRQEVRDTPYRDGQQQRLLGARAVSGFALAARDGDIGHVDDFIMEDTDWSIRYVAIDTRNWWPGKKVLLMPRWFSRISREERKAYTELNRRQIRNSPEYDDTRAIEHDDEQRVSDYYERTNMGERR